MLWPRNLSVFYPHLGDGAAEWKALTCGIFIALVTTWIVRCIRKTPYLAVGWFWYLGTLVPVIGIVQVGEQAMADRYTYLPMIGVFICIAWGIPELIRNQKILSVMAGIYIVLLIATTWGQVKYWKNSITLFEHAISINENKVPSFVIAYNNLGHALLSENRFQEAIVKFQRAIKINPNYSRPQNNLGNAFSELRKFDEAIKYYQQAIKIEPNYAEAFNNLANALRQTGKIEESIVYYNEAIRLKKDYDEAYFNLGITLSQQGEIGEAIGQYQKALEINSNFVMAHNNLASLLAQRKDIAGAIRHYKEAISIDPEFAQAYNNLGSTLAGQGKLEEAILLFEKAVSIDPNYINAQNNLKLARSLMAGTGVSN
jgi:tetratricopeptide (TPR) repeat protein